MIIEYKGREVELSLDCDLSDHFVSVVGAEYVDTGEELSEDEVSALESEKHGEIYQKAWERAADHAYEAAKSFRKYGHS